MATLISSALPDLDLEEQSLLIVDSGNPAAVITSMTIHFTQDVPQIQPIISVIPPLLGYVPTGGTEAPGFGPGG